MEELIDQYTNADEDTRLTRQYITRMEFDTTMHALHGWLTPGARVTELGAATGRYSLTFAQMGCKVTAVELVPDQVRILREKAAESDIDIDIHQGSACEVPFIADNSQDLCVILGPLYHLQTEQARKQVMEEAMRILKPGGVMAVAYISRFFVAGLFAQHFPHLITPQILDQLQGEGLVSSPEAAQFFNVGYFATPNEMEQLVDTHGFAIERHIATDGFGRYLASGINHFSPDQYDAWLAYHLKSCDEPSLLGASNHGLVIARKSLDDGLPQNIN
ncbi:methyltransferase domain-containing protein [Photobacterium sp. BZF1]|uniref:class I SAM-dependent methyltransferase n=1 Tax=Photobacterium sp. BZF1 TaxID=1904457 RepID=UPI0016539A60|nr:class I SAM-dependent methyltransferase [Photobacterium sp. BZF1]MBC7001062.1 methyltransferase domain-containing protein [Photobacterium sp. BZF1]